MCREWKFLITYPDEGDNNCYDINIFWSSRLLELCYSKLGEKRSTAKGFIKPLEQRTIEITFFENKDFENGTKVDVKFFEDFRDKKPKEVKSDNYIKIRVADSIQLRELNEIPE